MLTLFKICLIANILKYLMADLRTFMMACLTIIEEKTTLAKLEKHQILKFNHFSTRDLFFIATMSLPERNESRLTTSHFKASYFLKII